MRPASALVVKSLLQLGFPVVAAIVAFAEVPSRASDHSDGVKTALDLAADITDLFTFNSPKDPNKVVMIMNVNGFAGKRSLFSDVVDYKIRIRQIPDAKTLVPDADPVKEQNIVCSFTGGISFIEANQHATCKLNVGGATKTIEFDTRGGSYKAGNSTTQGGVRIFAGVRSDPWFADISKISAFDKGQAIDRSSPKNALDGKNVLSIAVEIDRSRLGGPLLAINAQTVRRSGL